MSSAKDTAEPGPATAKLEAEWTGIAAAPIRFQHKIPFGTASPVCESTKDDADARSQYLAALRAAVGNMQDDVNRMLTEKMAQDAAASALVFAHPPDPKNPREQQEEDLYGEEVVEEED